MDDWKLFRSKIGQWQEAYMDRLNHEYIELLSCDKSPSEKFWELEGLVRAAKRDPGVQLQMRKSEFEWDIARLIRGGVIGMEDLDDFSAELREKVKMFIQE